MSQGTSIVFSVVSSVESQYFRSVSASRWQIPFDWFLGEASIMTLAVLSTQRYLTLVCPERFKMSSHSTSFKLITAIWLFALCFSIPPFFGFGAFVPETSGITCAPDWESNQHLVYTLYWTVGGFLAPLVVITVSSFLTVKALKKVMHYWLTSEYYKADTFFECRERIQPKQQPLKGCQPSVTRQFQTWSYWWTQPF